MILLKLRQVVEGGERVLYLNANAITGFWQAKDSTIVIARGISYHVRDKAEAIAERIINECR